MFTKRGSFEGVYFRNGSVNVITVLVVIGGWLHMVRYYWKYGGIGSGMGIPSIGF
jgi:hypothetical protein